MTLKTVNLNAIAISGEHLLIDVNLLIEEGHVALLMGPNGCGKSTLLKVLAGTFDGEISGQIFWRGEDVSSLSTTERARKGFFMAFQDPVSIPGLSLIQLIKQSLESLGVDRGNTFAEALEITTELGKGRELLTRSLNVNCSGGEKKMGEYIQMHMLRPSMCLIDEIDSGLDVRASSIIWNKLSKLLSTRLVVTHSLSHGLQPHQVIIMKKGGIASTGDAHLLEVVKNRGYD